VTGTTGTGLMGSGLPDTLIIDPLPHNRAYFEDHLQFLSNYFGTVSKGAISFSALDVYPLADEEVYRLEYPMWHYNYNTEDELLDQRLVELFAETVNLASSDISFHNYDAVLIFHAGVGKDFNIGYDQTPFDIPSAFISEEDIQSYAGSIPPGITKGIILPESQNQEEVLEFDVQLSLNGVMVKLFGNWLGMPDLFDTNTGNSGIGRWGMMDQGSGNVNALVPSLPDIWTRIYMGWEEPLTVVSPGLKDTLYVARFNVSGAPEALKIPVTPDEYYLIENRDADADSIQQVTLFDRDGLELRINHEGDLEVQGGFKVAVSASHYDFGIPGSGLLIWHIDENVIDQKIDSNRVNSDPTHRGVDLVEADGSQDIGEEFAFATAGSGTELGIQEDAWYRDNRNHRDANGGAFIVRFNDRTRPSAKLHDKASTNIELSNFSDVDSIMSFTMRSTSTAEGFPLELEIDPILNDLWNTALDVKLPLYTVADLDGDDINEMCLITGDAIRVFDTTATEIWSTDLYQVSRFAEIGPQVDIDNDGRDEVLVEGTIVGILEYEGDEYRFRNIHSNDLGHDLLTVRPGISDEDQPRILTVPVDSASIMLLNLEFDLLDDVHLSEHALSDIEMINIESYPSNSFAITANADYIWIYSINDSSLAEQWSYRFRSEFGFIQILNLPTQRSVFIDQHGYYDAASGEELCLVSECVAPEVDWNGDGIPYGGGLSGTTTIQQEDKPQLDVDVQRIIDLDANGDPDIIGFSDESDPGLYTRIKAAEHTGPHFPDFPIASSGSPNSEFFKWGSNNFLHYTSIVQVDSSKYLSINRLPITASGSERFAYTEPEAIINIGPLRPQVHNRSDWVYCWPNPTSDISHIRFTSSTAATARIQIFDLAGRRVATLNGSSDGAGQFEVDWNVTGVQSGVYIAKAELVSGGKTHNSEVKIAVVK